MRRGVRGRCARVAAVVVCPGVSSIQLEAVHREVFVVHSYDLDWSEQLAVRALSSFLQEAARMHSEHLGVGITWLMERGLAWAVHRIKLEVLAAARLREALTVETWASGYDRLNAYRDFEVRGEGGRPIARASSAWVVFDALQRRAVKLPQEWIASGVPMPDRPRALELPKKKPPELSAPTTERPFRVRLGDLDVNGHTNNTRYLEWTVESVSSEMWGTHRLASLDITFRAESLYDDELLAQSERLPGDEVSFAHQLVRPRDGVDIARARTTWVPAEPSAEPSVGAYLRRVSFPPGLGAASGEASPASLASASLAPGDGEP